VTADAFGRFFLPGPAEVHPDVLAAMQRPMIGQRSAEMAELMARMERPLRHLFRTTRPVLLATCSATGLMEASIRAGVRHRLLAVVGGCFGERYACVAEACGKEVVRAVVPPGGTLEPGHLERFLDGPEIDAVSIVHSETATGALAPLEALARVVRSRKDVMLLVDAASSIGGQAVETDLWQLDFVFTGSQKALALPPGLGLAVASKRMMQRARDAHEPGWYFDLARYEEAIRQRRPSQVPPLPQLYALDAQLARIEAEGGIEARWRRHAAMLALMEAWCDRQPRLALMAPPGRRSATVSALRLPAGVASATIVESLAVRGWSVTSGPEPHADELLRIGHMGDLRPAHLEALLGELDEVLQGV
jgi:aspartate aminotransferase-like enzyme